MMGRYCSDQSHDFGIHQVNVWGMLVYLLNDTQDAEVSSHRRMRRRNPLPVARTGWPFPYS